MTPLIGEFFVAILFGKNLKQYEWATSQLGCPWEVHKVGQGSVCVDYILLIFVAMVFVLVKRP